MKPRLNPKDIFVVFHCYPTGHVGPLLLRWLSLFGVGWDAMMFTNEKLIPRAYNKGARWAIQSGKRELIFADHDVIPVLATPTRPGTDAFLNISEADIVCCPCELGEPGAWADPAAFHCGLWRTSREAILRVTPPRFLETFNADGTELRQDVCVYFAEKARAAGLTITRQGWADHSVKASPLHSHSQ